MTFFFFFTSNTTHDKPPVPPFPLCSWTLQVVFSSRSLRADNPMASDRRSSQKEVEATFTSSSAQRAPLAVIVTITRQTVMAIRQTGDFVDFTSDWSRRLLVQKKSILFVPSTARPLRLSTGWHWCFQEEQKSYYHWRELEVHTMTGHSRSVVGVVAICVILRSSISAKSYEWVWEPWTEMTGTVLSGLKGACRLLIAVLMPPSSLQFKSEQWISQLERAADTF